MLTTSTILFTFHNKIVCLYLFNQLNNVGLVETVHEQAMLHLANKEEEGTMKATHT